MVAPNPVFVETNPGQPFYVPEVRHMGTLLLFFYHANPYQFQGGSFDAWGPTAPGYDSCRKMTGPDFQSVFYRQLWASNAKLINLYMFYG